MEQVKVVQKGNIASKVETTQKNTKKKIWMDLFAIETCNKIY
jgi:hypothetical protein